MLIICFRSHLGSKASQVASAGMSDIEGDAGDSPGDADDDADGIHGDAGDSPDDADDDADADGIHGDAGPRRRLAAAVLPPLMAGPPRAFVICSTPRGKRWPGLAWVRLQDGYTHREFLVRQLAANTIVGVVLACSWSYTAYEAYDPSTPTGCMRRLAELQCKSGVTMAYGWMENLVIEAAVLHEPYEVGDGLRGVPQALYDVEADVFALGAADSQGSGTVRSILAQWALRGMSGPSVHEFHPTFAGLVIGGLWPVLNSVLVTNRLVRKRCLIHGEPPAKRQRRFIASHRAVDLGTAREAPDGRCSQHPWSLKAHKAPRVLAWLKATQYIKDLKNSFQAAKAYGEIFELDGVMAAKEVDEKVVKVCRETLRKARVTLDIVSMKLHRIAFSRRMATDAPRPYARNLYLYCDASPQWRGTEMFAATVDESDGTSITRCMLPLVSLARNQLDAIGKMVALLWQLWLIYGPSWDRMRAALSRVRGIVSDAGVERLIVDSQDTLDLFFMYMHPLLVPPDQRLSYPTLPYPTLPVRMRTNHPFEAFYEHVFTCFDRLGVFVITGHPEHPVECVS